MKIFNNDPLERDRDRELTPEDPMPFGKHQGTPIGDLPGDYIDWLLENIEDGPVLRCIEENDL